MTPGLAQAAPRNDDRLKRFLARLRHELRTPLNAIIGYSEMLLEDAQAAGPDAAELAGGLEHAGEAGRELLGQVALLLEPEPGTRPLDLMTLRGDLALGLGAPARSLLDEIDRLLVVARNAGPSLEAFVPDLRSIRAAVEELHRLVEQALTAEPADLADPAPRPEGASRTAATVAAAPAQAAARRGAVLVVDDSEINRGLLTRQLSRLGHTVATAANGRLALERLREARFDLVLLDVMMPEMDGYETLAHLKADAGLRDLPVIVISGLDEIAGVARCIEMGAEDFLPKPFDPVLLRARIDAGLEKKRLRDQEMDYLQNVGLLTAAAGAVEASQYLPESLDGVAARPDALGQLARVFQRMAREVREREERLKEQVQMLRIEVDEARKARQVAEITETEYFQELQRKARLLRSGHRAHDGDAE